MRGRGNFSLNPIPKNNKKFFSAIQTDGTQAYMIWHLRKNMPVEIGCVMWFGISNANTGAAVPVYVRSLRVPEEYREEQSSFLRRIQNS